MLYRRLGTWDASALGFGCMRLPLHGDAPDQIDEDEALRMLHYAIDHGVNYLDTAYMYHRGRSEELVGKALRGGYRQRVRVATKLPLWSVEKADDLDRILDEQCARLDAGRIDYYLVHAMSQRVWEKYREFNVDAFFERATADGRIAAVGFSFHDQLPLFKEVLDARPWALCQIQLNYMDRHYQAGLEGLRYAAGLGVPVVVMEPIKGGRLATQPPPEVQRIQDRAPVRRTPAAWALRWVLDHPEVTVVLSGMSTMEQVRENLATAACALPGTLTAAEHALVDEVTEVLRRKMAIGCTECGYCLPCPQNVVIPQVFGLHNDVAVYGATTGAHRFYRRLLDANRGAPACAECGQCEEKCPQQLAIIAGLKAAHAALAQD